MASTVGHFVPAAMHSVKHGFSSLIEKPRERMHIGYILNFHSHFGILGPVINVVVKCRLRSKDGIAEEVGTNCKTIFILLKGLPSDYKGTRSF